MAAAHLKVPKGTRDWFGADVTLRDHIFDTIRRVFKRHNGCPLETPVFELRDILTNKYGEDSKLIYNLEDQGGELCALRYDLTVPFARWLALNKVSQVKRYQIAKVYRRDQPAVARGRMREFHQCDFDIAGSGFDPMIPDAEILRIIVDVFDALGLDVTIKLNHRRILDGLFAIAGVPEEKMRTISAAVDKADKMPWADVEKEMMEKGLSNEVAHRLGEYVQQSGTIRSILKMLESNSTFSANANVKAGLDDMNLLAKYLEALGIKDDKVLFDLRLARGLDYYTHLIFEVVCRSGAPVSDRQRTFGSDATPVGSIAGGGRYDNLVGMFSRRPGPFPCVGVSFGVERIFTILKAREEGSQRTGQADVYVMAFGGKEFDGLLLERLAITSQLWDAGVKAEFTAKVKPKLPQQFKAAADVPLAVILGQDELAAGQVRVKLLGLPDGHPQKEGALVAKADVVAEVQRRLRELSV